VLAGFSGKVAVPIQPVVPLMSVQTVVPLMEYCTLSMPLFTAPSESAAFPAMLTLVERCHAASAVAVAAPRATVGAVLSMTTVRVTLTVFFAASVAVKTRV